MVASVESLVCHPSSPGSSDGYCSRCVSEFLASQQILRGHGQMPVFSPEVFVNAKMDCFFGLKLKKNFAKSPGNQVKK